MAALRRDPGLIPKAVEEALRLEPPTMWRFRRVAVDTELHGVVRSAVGGAVTAQLGVMPEIAVLSATQAEGVWKMEDVVDFAAGASEHPRLEGVRRLHGFGHYHEQYSKIDGRWRIAHCRLTRIAIEFDRE